MSASKLYDPFIKFDLGGNKCFLTGTPISKGIDTIHVFPEWILKDEMLFDKSFKLLDESYCTYDDLRMPCSNDVKEKLSKLNSKTEIAFKTGNHSELSNIEWFQWAGIILYGLIYSEIKNGVKSEEYKEEGFRISPALIRKFKDQHFFLQSILHKMEWDHPLPFSLMVFNIEENDEAEPFDHRNEINTLTFSFRYKKLGMIICLQDAGANAWYHGTLLKKMESHSIHPIQFSELCAKFYYSNYLLSLLPAFEFITHGDTVYANNAEASGTSRTPFDPWDNKTYAQVLEAFWKPWQYSKLEILKNPEKPLSFIENDEGDFIENPQPVKI